MSDEDRPAAPGFIVTVIVAGQDKQASRREKPLARPALDFAKRLA